MNLFYILSSNKVIADETSVKSLVHRRIQRNAFFAHSENILLAQLSSTKKVERVDAVRKILKIRERPQNASVRIFKVPVINFEAKRWIDMMEYDFESTEPPLKIGMDEDELIAIIEEPLVVAKFKCHTQMVERAVKEVTRTSLNAFDHQTRNSMVKATLIHRAKYPKLNSAKDFCLQSSSENQLPKI